MYQKPEQYVRDFVNGVLGRVGACTKREEVTAEGIRMFVDYQYGKVLIEAEAPGRRSAGRDQLLRYMRAFGYRFGLVVDVPTPQYYEEYPRPFKGPVGFELYLGDVCVLERSFSEEEVGRAGDALEFLLKVLGELKIASVEPRPENVLTRIKRVSSLWEKRLLSVLPELSGRVGTYMRVWRRNMSLLYGEDVLRRIEGDLSRLFIKLTIYTCILKVLGSTILESMLGGGRYTIPLRLLQEGYRAATELFWERRALMRFNVNYIFERDEYDWVFAPEVAERVDGFFRDVGRALAEIDWGRPVGLDLLKRVYQNIVDVTLRRQLGEFYTPDWLAKLILWRALHVLVKGGVPKELMPEDIDSRLVDLIDEFYGRWGRIPRFVDPTCGSFTFGIQYVDTILKWYGKTKPNIHPIQLAYMILQNIVGIDLNPVAVITAKVNYLLQIYRLLTLYGNYLYEEPMIPIYRVNLLVLHEVKREKVEKGEGLLYYFRRSRSGASLRVSLSDLQVGDDFVGRVKGIGLPVKYDEGLKEHYIELRVPQSLIRRFGDNLMRLHRALMALRAGGAKGFEAELRVGLSDVEKEALRELTRLVEGLESCGIDGVWYSILMNHILAVVASGRGFDLVVGNLPWVNISKYLGRYGQKLKAVARELGVEPPGEAMKKLDVSVVLYAISAEYLSRRGSVIALMMPASVFRGLHGSGWRSFLAEKGFKLYEVFDLESIRPFEGAQNQPGVVIAMR